MRSARVSNKSSGLLGVSFNKKQRKFVALISVGGRKRFLGHYDTAVDAHASYITAKRELHPGGTI